ncbi:MAG: hypothetical protein Q4F75_03945 [Pseudomonadota bacterium]|nr:hypothetical protein [Pseudomonadota bacterium]
MKLVKHIFADGFRRPNKFGMTLMFLAAPFTINIEVFAADCAIHDCASLGYTSSSNSDNCLKCPFGNYWACACSSAFKYNCTGPNEQPETNSCGGKYKYCSCDKGYIWKDGKCTIPALGDCSGEAKNCEVGWILNNDGSCLPSKVESRTPIGVIAYISTEGCGYAISIDTMNDINNIHGATTWSTDTSLETGVFKSNDWQVAIKDYDSCYNTKKLVSRENAETLFPAAWTVYNYAPATNPETKGKWCLPAAGIWHQTYLNRGKISDTFYDLTGSPFAYPNSTAWSSTEESMSSAWIYNSNSYGAKRGGLYTQSKGDYTRIVTYAVIEF